jgi:diacylglycerol kinase family enzyme
VLDNQNRKEYQRGILFSVFMNTRYEGGGFLFCPEAEPCDDFLDICLVEKLPKLMILCVLPTAFFGKHVIFKKMVHIERCKKAVLTMEEAVPIHTDGENAGVKKVVEVSLEEQPLNFIIR